MYLLAIIFCTGVSIPLIFGAWLLVTARRHAAVTTETAVVFHHISRTRGPGISFYTYDKFETFLRMCHDARVQPTSVHALMHPAATTPQQPYTRRFALTFDDGYESVYTHAAPLLDRYGCSATVFVVAGYIGLPPSWDIYRHGRHVSAAQIRALSDQGIEIGSHTLTHPDLTGLPDELLDKELSASKKTLEDITGVPVTSLSVPYGSWDARVWAHARRCGYAYCCAYRGQSRIQNGMVAAYGVYSFEPPRAVLAKTDPHARLPLSRGIGIVCAQGARISARVGGRSRKGIPSQK
jgi:peptidoglycan/xylan/chitin deacetylase (PgdA/CDA1 family)